MTTLERVPEDPELEVAEQDETLVEDRAEVAEDLDDPLLRNGGADGEHQRGRAGRQRESDGAPAAYEMEEESEYAETELDVDDTSSVEEELDEDTDDNARRKGYLSVCQKLHVVPLSSIVKTPNAKRIDVPFHGLGDKCVAALMDGLKGGGVEMINFRENRMTSQGLLKVTPLLCQFRHLLEFDISNNSLGSPAVKPLCDVMRACVTLQKVAAAGNLFGDKDAGPLAEEIGTNKHLLHLDLSHNNFGEFSGLCFGNALSVNACLLTLDLSWNQIRRNGGVAIANGVRSNSRLTTLHIGWNALSDIGAMAMAEALKFNSSLEVLDMANNRVGPDASISIGKALQNGNSTLKVLRLGLNPLTNEGVSALVDAVKANQTLTEVNLAKVPVMDTLREKIEELLKPSPRLQAARAGRKRAHHVFELESESWQHTARARELLDAARADAAAAATPAQKIVTQALLDGRLACFSQRLAGPVREDYEKYAAALQRVELGRARGGQAAMAAKAAVAALLCKNPHADEVLLLTAARQAAEEHRSADSLESSDAVARDAVSGDAAAQAALQLSRLMLADESADMGAAQKAVSAVFEAGRGPAFHHARAAFTTFRAAHPKDLPGALQVARDAYAGAGGLAGYDPTAEIVEEDAFIAARESMLKTLAENGGRGGQETSLENAARAYRAHHGKRPDAFLADLLEACLAERDLWDSISSVVSQHEEKYVQARNKLADATAELQNATEADLAEGRRPGFRFVIDEAASNGIRRRQSGDPFLILEEYIDKRKLRLIDIFRTFDNDGSGKITRQEFHDGIETIGVELTPPQIAYIIDVADLDGDGHIDYQEFAKLRESSKLNVARDLLQRRMALEALKTTKEGQIAFGHLRVEVKLPGHTGGGLSFLHKASQDE